MRTAAAVLFSLCLATPALAQAPAPAPAQAAPAAETFTVVAAQSTVTYHLVHKLHKVDGVSRKVEGKARLLSTGVAQVMLRAPVESFDSDNANRDAHMKETVEAARYPTVEIKAQSDGITAPQSYPATVKKTFKAEINFHGIKKPMDLPVELTFESATRVKATASFAISLEAFKVERPSMFLVKVNDDLKLDASVVFSK